MLHCQYVVCGAHQNHGEAGALGPTPEGGACLLKTQMWEGARTWSERGPSQGTDYSPDNRIGVWGGDCARRPQSLPL